MMQNRGAYNMKVIGLTGGIACGKSTVSCILKELGAAIIDADEIARQIIKPGRPALGSIIDTFGDEYLRIDGGLDRKKLGDLVFSQPEALKLLNSIVHPAIVEEIKNTIISLKGCTKYKAIVVDAALLIETGLTELVDEVWVVSVPYDIQLSRLKKRSNLTFKEARDRIESQMTDSERFKYADKIIDNSKSMEDTREQVLKLWQDSIL
jgi:dephospho-CoA kinase